MHRTHLAAWAAAIIWLLSAPSGAADRALLIGINQYQDPNITHLNGTLNDLASFRELLEAYWAVPATAIKTLTNDEATHDGILEAIDRWLIDGTNPGDRVFLFYSGHGYQVIDQNRDETDGLDEVLVSYDARLIEKHRLKNATTDDEIGRRLARLRGRHVLVAVDSCHSGTVTRGILDNVVRPKSLRRDEGRVRSIDGLRGKPDQGQEDLIEADAQVVALFAVSAQQEAHEMKAHGRPVGVFTASLHRGLLENTADRDRDGRVSFAELEDHARAAAAEFCAFPLRCPGGMTPKFQIDDRLRLRSVRAFGRDHEPVVVHPEDLPAVLGDANEARIALRLSSDGEARPDGRFREGELMEIGVRADRDGQLLLFDIGEQGEIFLLYPNPDYNPHPLVAAAGPGRIVAGREARIPDAYQGQRLRMASGDGRIIAVLLEDPIELADLARIGRSVTGAPAASDWLASLKGRLSRTLLTEADQGGSRPARWSLASRAYHID